jgi:xanthine/CO dehydrogenase XdhC/CoxF family maturation factor
MSVRQILQSFDAWRAAGTPLVLATVYETVGSTYSKPGHRILIAADGDYRGLVSGGCLEGDLSERARAVLAADRSTPVTYDLRDAADEIFGLGVGCNGLLRVFLQPLRPERDYEPFASIAAALVGRERAALATVIESAGTELSAGATVLCSARATRAFGVDGAAAARLEQRARRTLATGTAELATEAGDSCSAPVSMRCRSLRWRPSSVGSSPSRIIGPLISRAAVSRAPSARCSSSLARFHTRSSSRRSMRSS